LEVIMIGLGIAVAAVAALILSSVYYAAATPLERRAVGEAALDRGRPQPWKVLTEVVRTAVVAAAFAWIAHRAEDLNVSHALELALIMWVGFPLVLLTGSVIWEKVHPATAAMHAGDWLLKLLLIAVILGLLH
jgi:thiosulfate reductase cytochrome b subunit